MKATFQNSTCTVLPGSILQMDSNQVILKTRFGTFTITEDDDCLQIRSAQGAICIQPDVSNVIKMVESDAFPPPQEKATIKINVCPHCGREDVVPGVVFSNVENYGSNAFHITCKHCGKMIRVSLSRGTQLNSITPSDRPVDEADF